MRRPRCSTSSCVWWRTKVDDLAKGGIDVVERVPLVVGFGRHNLGYMRVKRDKGHQIPAEAVEAGAITSSPGQARKKS